MPTSQVIVPELGWWLWSWSEEGLELEELQPEPMRSGASPLVLWWSPPCQRVPLGIEGVGTAALSKLSLSSKGMAVAAERLLPGEPCVMLGFVTPGGEDVDPGSETRLDYLELFVQQSFIKV